MEGSKVEPKTETGVIRYKQVDPQCKGEVRRLQVDYWT